ncbi:hydroxyacid dehydrogenase [uncultured Microbacterium sp.]|uniref:hydroxyacid dehydrogenase n=1 Tax=uncultured Microbacterium sp. TaxID=191216 RepID=UPI0035CAB285
MTPSTRPNALIVMSPSAFRAQFDHDRLDRLADLTTLAEPIWTDNLDSPELLGRLASVDILLTGWSAPALTDERLNRMPNLRAMFHCAGSVRYVVTDAFWERNIVASNAADANAIPVAEYTLAAIIFAGKKAPFLAADARVFREDWGYAQRRGELSNRGRTIGIVGFSRVGRRVVSLVQQLDPVTCLVADPYADPAEVAAAGATLVSLAEMLPRVDVLSLHAPALPGTHHMIDAKELAALPDHATVINTARGSLINTQALEFECATGRISAILDVSDPEPLPASSVLYDLPGVMITPHIAGSMGSELHRMTDAALDELGRYVQGLELVAELSSENLRLSA